LESNRKHRQTRFMPRRPAISAAARHSSSGSRVRVRCWLRNSSKRLLSSSTSSKLLPCVARIIAEGLPPSADASNFRYLQSRTLPETHDFSAVKQKEMETVSLIRTSLWSKAKWAATGYGTDEVGSVQRLERRAEEQWREWQARTESFAWVYPSLDPGTGGRRGCRPHKMTTTKLRLVRASMGNPETRLLDLCAELTRESLYRHVAPDGALRPDGKSYWSQKKRAG
jgi:hypothetical protein